VGFASASRGVATLGGPAGILLLLSLVLAACSQATEQPATLTAEPAATVGAAGIRLPTPTPEPGATPQAVAVQGGGTINLSLAGDPDSLNPILATNGAAALVNRFIFPTLLSPNPYTGQWSTDNAMAASYQVSPDGLAYTFDLRPNVTWSDGDPVDAADFKFTYDAILSDQVESPYRSLLGNLAGIDVLSPLRVQVRLRQALCDGLSMLRLGWLPSHLYAADFTDIMENRYNANPAVSAGPFVVQSWAPNENVVMRRNQRYWQGVPAAERLVFHIDSDATERFARLLEGSLDVAALDASQLASVQANPDISVFGTSVDGYDFVALNLANPENPQPGADEAGNRLVQEPHPVLGDLSVRQAIARAIDYTAAIDSIYLKRGYQIPSNVLPIIPWAHDTSLALYTYDPVAARQILEDAGWLDTNNDGIRERERTVLVLELLVVQGNTVHEQLADLVQDQLNSVGFDITVTPVDAATLASELLGQRFDMVITGWTGLGADPNDDWLWTAQHDRPSSDFNFASYHNAEVDRLLREANTVPGCRPEDRAPLYKQVQRLIHDDLPYIFITGMVADIGYSRQVAGVRPATWDFYWNIHEWYKIAPQP
jgi:peptide/nickel transport system substrate-binding protein